MPPFLAAIPGPLVLAALSVPVLAGCALGFAYGLPLVIRRWQARRWTGRGKGLVALTYDDGPDPVTTPAVLDLLDQLGVTATFYLVGFRAEQNRDVVKRLCSSRHELGTHTYSHKNAWKKGPIFEWRDSRRGYAALDGVVAPDAPFRPPFGKASLITVAGMRAKGRRVDWWTAAANDTRDDRPDPAGLATRLLDDGSPVLLMHCHHAEPDRRSFVLSLTRELVEQGRARGLRFVTMKELTEARP